MASQKFVIRKLTPDQWSTREQLCLASSVARSGDQNWVSVSRAIKPFAEPQRKPDWFSQKNCAMQYSYLLETVDSPKCKRKRIEKGTDKPDVAETPVDMIVRRLTQDRIEELKKLVQEEQRCYKRLKDEIEQIWTGSLDEKLKDMYEEIVKQQQAAEELAEAHRLAVEEHKASTEETKKLAAGTQQFDDSSSAAESPLSEPLSVEITDDESSQQGTVNDISWTVQPVKKTPPHSPLLSSLLMSKPPFPPVEHATSTAVGDQFHLRTDEHTTPPKKASTRPSTPAASSPVLASSPTLVQLLDSPIKANQAKLVIPSSIVTTDVTHVDQHQAVSETKQTEPLTEIAMSTAVITTKEAIAGVVTTASPVSTVVIATADAPARSTEIIQDTLPKIEVGTLVAVVPATSSSALEQVETMITTTTATASTSSTMTTTTTTAAVTTTIEINGHPEEDSVALDAAALSVPDKPLAYEQEKVEENEKKEIEVQGSNLKEATADTDKLVSSETEKIKDDSSAVQKPVYESSKIATAEAKEEAGSKVSLNVVENIISGRVEPSSPASSVSSKVSEADVQPSKGRGRPRKRKGPGAVSVMGKRDITLGEEKAVEETKSEFISTRLRSQQVDTETTFPSSKNTDAELGTLESDDSVQKRDLLVESLPGSPASGIHGDGVSTPRDLKAWKRSIMLVWRSAANHKYASVFLHPVTDDVAPGYSSVVHKPMDLTTIKRNIETGIIRSTVEFQRDMMTMFENAIMYNNRDQPVFAMAQEMQADVIQHIQDFLATQLVSQPLDSKVLRDRGKDARKSEGSDKEEVDKRGGRKASSEAEQTVVEKSKKGKHKRSM